MLNCNFLAMHLINNPLLMFRCTYLPQTPTISLTTQIYDTILWKYVVSVTGITCFTLRVDYIKMKNVTWTKFAENLQQHL